MSADWTPDALPPRDGDVVVVTGANSGIGYEATRVFAHRGATVVMACRSIDRGEDAAAALRGHLDDPSLDVRACDLGDLANIAAFADGVAADYDGIRALCNNAGVMAIPRSETTDGFERQFGVNHLGHFALTGHLLDVLVSTDGESRVVTQSSGVHERGTVDFEDLQSERSYDKWGAYAQSKLANVLFGYELDRRLDDRGVDGVTSVVCHPGYADTNLQYRGPEQSRSRLRLWGMKVANALLAQSPEQGAWPMLYATTDDDIDGGEYVGPAGFMNMRGAPSVQESSAESYDDAVAARLWDVSADLTGVTYPFDAIAAES